MQSAPIPDPGLDSESIQQSFRVVESNLDPQTLSVAQRPGPEVVYVDYNSPPAVARNLSKIGGLGNIHLSLPGIIVLVCVVCLATAIACFFLFAF